MSTRPVVATPQPADFGRDYPEAYQGMKNYVETLVAGRGPVDSPPIITRRTKSLESLRLEQGARELKQQMEAQGWTPAIVVNLNPWAIKVNGVLHTEILPACPSPSEWRQAGKEGKPYAYIIIDEYGQDTRDRGDGNWTCHPFVPMQLAQDYLKECEVTKWGGVFYYPGRALPNDPYLPPELRARIDKEWNVAHKKLLGWARMVYAIADRAANAPNGDKRIIGDMERRGAIWLHDNGYLPKGLPRWVEAVSDDAVLQKECPACHNKVDIQSIVCGNGRCTYIFDPRAAYVTGLIDDTNSNLRRLTRAELDQLELPHVKSISHLAGVPKVEPVPTAEAETPEAKFANGELPEPEDVLDPEELAELVTDDPLKVAEQAAATGDAAEAERPAARKAKGKTDKPKSEQQKRAEEALGE